jgi:ATP phosphoribosyltransferase regulatory subunit HisZ
MMMSHVDYFPSVLESIINHFDYLLDQFNTWNSMIFPPKIEMLDPLYNMSDCITGEQAISLANKSSG